MGLFSELFGEFSRNKAFSHLARSYSDINKLAKEIRALASELRRMQKSMISAGAESRRREGAATGEIHLKKAGFIEEEFIKRLEELEKAAEERFNSSINEIGSEEPVSAEESVRIENVLKYLNEVKGFLPSIEDINRIMERREKLERINNALANTVKLSKEFHENERMFGREAKTFLRNQISPLLKDVYENAKEEVHRGAKILVYRLKSEEQLREIEDESENINLCKDPNYVVDWREWWEKRHVFEVDENTPLKEPHVNVGIKLFGRARKEIHLALAA